MDFNRSGQPRPVAAPPVAAAGPQKLNILAKRDGWKRGKVYRASFVALLLSATILFIALIFYIVFGPPINREAGYIDGTKYQAVFVNVNGTNGGQVYFGKVTALTSSYIRLINVFYIQNQSTDATTTNGSYNLVKLGCELHGPTDEMIINRSEVFFWENLKSDSQVAQKAAEFYKQNPDGQKCSATSNTTQTGTGAATTATPTPTPAATTPPAASTTKP
jgi:hypothetical protein